MVSKQDRLDPCSNFCKRGDASPGSFVVEAGQQVVADERHGFCVLGILIQIGKAQGQVELEGGAFAHCSKVNGMICIAPSHQVNDVFIVRLLLHSDEAICSKQCEQLACLLDKRLFLVTAMLLNCVGQQYLGEAFHCPCPRALNQLRLGIFPKLNSNFRTDSTFELGKFILRVCQAGINFVLAFIELLLLSLLGLDLSNGSSLVEQFKSLANFFFGLATAEGHKGLPPLSQPLQNSLPSLQLKDLLRPIRRRREYLAQKFQLPCCISRLPLGLTNQFFQVEKPVLRHGGFCMDLLCLEQLLFKRVDHYFEAKA